MSSKTRASCGERVEPSGRSDKWRRLECEVVLVDEPALLREWMTPIANVEAEVDLRVGGALRIAMKGEGRVIEHTGIARTKKISRTSRNCSNRRARRALPLSDSARRIPRRSRGVLYSV